MNRLVVFVSATVLTAIAVAPGVRTPTGLVGPPRHDRTRLLDSSVNRIAVIGDSYTAGSDEGGRGANSWTALTWQALAGRGVDIAADVAAEGRAGYGVPGDHGSTFTDLTGRAVRPDDALVVFFGSRNDADVDPAQLTRAVRDTLGLARRTAPAARLLVIGPPWPTADVPGAVLRIRDVVAAGAAAADGQFADPIAAGWFVGRPDLIGSDRVHPNDAGHAYLADMITPLIGGQLPTVG